MSCPKIFLDVSFNEKDKAKSLGAKWDSVEKKWYTYADNPLLMKLNEYFTESIEAVRKIVTKMQREIDRQPKPLKPQIKRSTTLAPIKLEPGQTKLQLKPLKRLDPTPPTKKPPPKNSKPVYKQSIISSFNSIKIP